MRSVELCAGAGGLALATTQAGFRPLALLESDPVACETITENQRRGSRWAEKWPTVSPVDIRNFDYSSVPAPLDLLSGGPPCQPFSRAGKHLGIEDDRDLFAEVARAIRRLHPRAFLIENTEGLAGDNFQRQLRYIRLQLAFPESRPRKGEHWQAFLARLERLAAATKTSQLRYSVSCAVLNAADYGVPQLRKRLIMVGFRGADQAPFIPPPPTHSLDALLYEQWVTGDYWHRHKVAARGRPEQPEKWKTRIKRLPERQDSVSDRHGIPLRDAFESPFKHTPASA
jgi:DNA (cytosine-5)-methyltransferase 1